METKGLISNEDFVEIEKTECLNADDMLEVEVVDVAFSYGEHRIRATY